MFQKSQTTSKNHIDDDKEHRKYVPAMTNRAEKHTGDNKTCRKGALAITKRAEKHAGNGNAKNRVGNDKNAQ